MYPNLIKQVILFIIFFSISITKAQVDTLWTKTLGGGAKDYGESGQQTRDEGYIIAGYTQSYGAGDYDLWLIKTNSSGDTLWTRTFGGISPDYGNSVQQTSDEGYIIAGYTNKSYDAGNYDLWLIKTNSSGDTLWTKTFYGIYYNEGYQVNISVQQTIDEGYIIISSTELYGVGDSDIWLIKTNSSGDTLWTRTFGGISPDYGNSVQQTSDEGYIIAGYTYSFGDYSSDVWLIKTNVSGDTLWTRTYGGSVNDRSNSVRQTKDEGYIIIGSTQSFGAGDSDIWLIKTNAFGDSLWTKTFGGNRQEEGYSIQQTIEEGYIITGYTSSFGAGNYDVWLIKTNASGDTLWTKTIGGDGYQWGKSIQLSIDGGYIIVGGISSWGGDVFLIKTTPDVSTIKNDNINIFSNYSLTQNYPNPFNPSTTIEFDIPTSGFVSLKVYNIMGQEIATLINKELSAGSHKVEWKPENISSGIYFYKLETKGYQETKKLVFMK